MLSRLIGDAMRLQYWLAILAGGAVVAASATALPNTLSSVDPNAVRTNNEGPPLPMRESQLRPAPTPQATPQAPQPQQAPGSAPTTQKTETTKYDSWVVVCQEGAGTKKSCSASLRVAAQAQNQRHLLMSWEIGLNKDGRYISAFRVPPIVTTKKGDKTVTGPLLVQNGVELKFGNGQARRLAYMWCGPKQCVAEGLIDDTFIKEALANTNATVTLYTSDGTASPMEIPIKGIDKAISATRK
jgi:invasion protein IalB